MSEAPCDPELTAVERALGRLTPAAEGLNRDQLLFRAGQASVRRPGWWWPAATGMLASVLVAGVVAWLVRPEPQAVVHVVYVTVPQDVPAAPKSAEPSLPQPVGPVAAAAPDRRLDESAYLHLRDRVLRFGVDALPQPPPDGPAAIIDVLDLSPRSLNRTSDPN